MNSYLLFKSLHLIAVVSWMAGLLYLPRIFVYHVENKEKKEATDIFEVMEKKLFLLHNAPSDDFHLDIWFNFNLLKWNRNIFSIVDANKIGFSYIVISL
jgi:uncharacterized integral membrane protein (TIGR00701 family)